SCSRRPGRLATADALHHTRRLHLHGTLPRHVRENSPATQEGPDGGRAGAQLEGLSEPRAYGVGLLGPMGVPMMSPETTSSTLRFFWRPAAVSFEATGFSLPKPLAVTFD